MEAILVAVQMRDGTAHEMTVSALDAEDAEYQALLKADDRFEGTLKSVNALA